MPDSTKVQRLRLEALSVDESDLERFALALERIGDGLASIVETLQSVVQVDTERRAAIRTREDS